MSSEDEDERRFQDVFIKTTVSWEFAGIIFITLDFLREPGKILKFLFATELISILIFWINNMEDVYAAVFKFSKNG